MDRGTDRRMDEWKGRGRMGRDNLRQTGRQAGKQASEQTDCTGNLIAQAVSAWRDPPLPFQPLPKGAWVSQFVCFPLRGTPIQTSLCASRIAMATTSHRSAKWDVSGSALGSAPKGALGNRSAPRGAPEGAQGNPGCSRECSRECSMWSVNRKSTLGSTPWSTPDFPEHPPEHPPEHSDFPEHPWEHFPEHFQKRPI